MSFAQDVKKEIANLVIDDFSLEAELYGYLKLKLDILIRNNKIVGVVKTNYLPIVRRIKSIINKLFNYSISIIEKKRNNLDKKSVYLLSLEDESFSILERLHLIDNDYNYIEEIWKDYPSSDVIRGMFLAKGSINDPKCSRYHFEICCNTTEEKEYIIKEFNKYNINAKSSIRRNNYIVYVKKSEHIGDALKLIGTTSTLFAFENERIIRDFNNSVNRYTNCDIANGDKTQKAANRQLENIQYIESIKGFENLSVRLMEASTLRIQNPDATLQELSDMSEEVVGRYISKSGLNHCFNDLETYVLALKSLENKKVDK